MCFAYRVGLVGNPSDGFYGKTIALSIRNFWAEVTIVENDKLVSALGPVSIQPNPDITRYFIST